MFSIIVAVLFAIRIYNNSVHCLPKTILSLFIKFAFLFSQNNLASLVRSWRWTLDIRNGYWTGLGLDWIRTHANFIEFGLDLDCKTLQNLGFGPDLDLVN